MSETHVNAYSMEIAEKRAKANSLNAEADALQNLIDARTPELVEEVAEPAESKAQEADAQESKKPKEVLEVEEPTKIDVKEEGAK